MGNIGGGEVLVILLAALLILGPSKLPEVARQMGKALGEFRKVTSGFQRELHDAMSATDEAEARRRGDAVAATRPAATAPTTDADPAGSPANAEPSDAPGTGTSAPAAHDGATPTATGGDATPGDDAATAVRPELDDHH